MRPRFALLPALAIILISLAAPWLAPFAPNDLHLHNVLESPNITFWLGTDALGRDVLSRLLFGAQISLSVGLVAVGLSTALGIFIGATAATGGRWADAILMRATDIMLCFPTIFLILAVITMLEPSLLNVMVIIGLTSWMGTARLVRAELLSLKTRPFLEASQLAGSPRLRQILWHLLPNTLPPILTSASLGLAAAILTESGLSFLGLGVQPPTASWGAMLTEGKGTMEAAWWLITFPGLAIVGTVLAFTLPTER